jgi:hypothetical protein
MTATYVCGSDFARINAARGGKAGYEPGDVLVVSTKAPGASREGEPTL